jgi:hypothetical protein
MWYIEQKIVNHKFFRMSVSGGYCVNVDQESRAWMPRTNERAGTAAPGARAARPTRLATASAHRYPGLRTAWTPSTERA